MEQSAVGTSSDFVDNVGLEIGVDSSWNIFAATCKTMSVSFVVAHHIRLTSLAEEGAETLIGIGSLSLLGQVTIGLFWISIAHFEIILPEIPEYHAQDSRAPSRSLQFGNQPGRLESDVSIWLSCFGFEYVCW